MDGNDCIEYIYAIAANILLYRAGLVWRPYRKMLGIVSYGAAFALNADRRSYYIPRKLTNFALMVSETFCGKCNRKKVFVQKQNESSATFAMKKQCLFELWNHINSQFVSFQLLLLRMQNMVWTINVIFIAFCVCSYPIIRQIIIHFRFEWIADCRIKPTTFSIVYGFFSRFSRRPRFYQSKCHRCN